jgi:hypothetical protein
MLNGGSKQNLARFCFNWPDSFVAVVLCGKLLF